MPEKTVIAAFDFDGTLTYRDTLMPFLLHATGPAKFTRHLTGLTPTLAGYAVGLLSNHAAKETVLTRFFAGYSIQDFEQLADRFAANSLPRLIRPDSLNRLVWHRRQGHRCIVVSASLEAYLKPWASQVGIDEVIGSRLEIQANGRLTGRLLGANCYGAEKVRRLEALIGSKERYTLYAYGDSRGDRELLAFADHPFYRIMPTG